MNNPAMYEVTYSETFRKSIRKVTDAATRERITKQILRIMEDPTVGKPLRYELKNKRSLRVHPFRIIYEYTADEGKIILHSFEHRKEAYTE